jgi:hypothetical protein
VRFEVIIPADHPEKAKLKAAQCIETLPTGQRYRVLIEEYKKTRSEQQNSTYWMWLTEIGEHIGYASAELHEVCRQKFLPQRVVQLPGERNPHTVNMSTTKLSISDMSDYLTQIQKLAAELGVQLTQPQGDSW